MTLSAHSRLGRAVPVTSGERLLVTMMLWTR